MFRGDHVGKDWEDSWKKIVKTWTGDPLVWSAGKQPTMKSVEIGKETSRWSQGVTRSVVTMTIKGGVRSFLGCCKSRGREMFQFSVFV